MLGALTETAKRDAGYPLKFYKTRQRDHFFMHGIAASLSDEKMQELAAYFSGKPAMPEGSK